MSEILKAATVLVIDDQDFMRMVLKRMLTVIGCGTVLEASDGQSGLDAVAAHRPDIVLCDIEMVPMDGYGFLAALRADAEPLRSIPVLFLSGEENADAIARATALGAQGYLMKPVAVPLLRERLETVLAPVGG